MLGGDSAKYIRFADPEVERICLAHWDTDHNGKLSYKEAAAVRSVGANFRHSTSITTFEEIQYFGLESLGDYAFSDTPNLACDIVLPYCTRIGLCVFYEGGSKLGSGITGINAPLCTSVANFAFRKCNQLVTAILPSVITTGQSFIESGIQKIYFRDIETIGSYCFQDCSRLETMVIDNITPPALQGYALNRTPSTMRIYVPDSAVDTYKAATGWSSYASKIHPMSELPE